MRPTPIRVAVHVRPLLESESREGAASIVVVGAGNRVGASAAAVSGAAAASPLSFGPFDGTYGASSRDPSALYADLVEPLVRAVVEDAENACVLAYGATGGGKTHTMGTTPAAAPTAAVGGASFAPLAPAAIRDVCARCEQLRQAHGPDAARVYASCLEVYGDALHDLLAAPPLAAPEDAEPPSSFSSSSSSPPPPAVIAWRDVPGGISGEDSADQSLSLPGLVEVPADDPEAALAALRAACRGRSTAATGANARSSRSHAVFCLRVRTTRRAAGDLGSGGGGETCEARLMLVDLAGSERQARSGAGGARLAEACAINQGLLALGNVIDALAHNARATAAAAAAGGGGGQVAGVSSSAALALGGGVAATSRLTTPCSSCPSSPRFGGPGPLVSLAPFVPPLALPPGGLGPGAANAPAAANAGPPPPPQLRHVPFRSHVLTRLLRPALGGSSRTVMVACVSPSDAAWPETCCSLRYAQRLRAVRTRPRRGVLLPASVPATGAADAEMAAAALRAAREQLGRALEERAGLEARARGAEERAEALEARLREAEGRERRGEKGAAAATSPSPSPMKRRDAVVALGPGGDAPSSSPGRARQLLQQQQQQQKQQLARALAAAEARLREAEPRAAQRDEAVRQLVEARLALAEAEEALRRAAEQRAALVARWRGAEDVRRTAAAASAAAASASQQGVVGAATAAVGAALASLTGSLRS